MLRFFIIIWLTLMLKNDKIITDIIGFVEKICKMYMEGENEDEN